MTIRTLGQTTTIINVRAHHVPCWACYANVVESDRDRYTPAFRQNAQSLADRINGGENRIRLVVGPDDMCGKEESPFCGYGAAGMCREPIANERDRLALESLNQLFPHMGYWAEGEIMTFAPGIVDGVRMGRIKGLFRSVCEGCGWLKQCNAIQSEGFARGVVHAPTPEQVDHFIGAQTGVRPQGRAAACAF